MHLTMVIFNLTGEKMEARNLVHAETSTVLMPTGRNDTGTNRNRVRPLRWQQFLLVSCRN